MPVGAGNPPNIKMEPPKSNFNIREGGGAFNIRGKRLPYRILNMNHKKELPRLWVAAS